MALTNLELVRYGIGDITLPYILVDATITAYLTSNSDDVDATIEELQPIVLAAIAARSGYYRTEDLIDDTTKQTDSYIRAIEKVNKLRASSAYPIIGGCDTKADNFSVDMFDEENNYDDEDTFYNGIEDI